MKDRLSLIVILIIYGLLIALLLTATWKSVYDPNYYCTMPGRNLPECRQLQNKDSN